MATINGTFNSFVGGTISGSVGVPGPAGQTGPAGPQGLPGTPGAPGVGVPAGGLTGQVLLKVTDTSYDTAWFDNYASTVQSTVRNETGATLTKGTVVYISGASGNKPLVSKASASTEAGSSKTFAILAADIPNNQNGQAVTMGLLKGINTSSFTAGANIWLSTTAGQIVSPTPPASPAHAVFLGNVVRVHAMQGEIEVRIQNGLELGELHDVLLTSPTNGQVLKYDSASGLWKNGTDSAGVAWGGITGTLSAQTDLQTALDGKYSTTNPAGYITNAALAPYLTSATAASTYQTLAGMSTYATQAFVTSQGYITSSALTPYLTSSTAAATYQTIAAMSAYLTTSSAASTYQTLAGMSSYLTTSAAASTYQTQSGMSNYLAKADNLSGLANTGTARTNLGLGTLATVNDAPSDGSTYGRNNGAWVVAGGGGDFLPLTGGTMTGQIIYNGEYWKANFGGATTYMPPGSVGSTSQTEETYHTYLFAGGIVSNTASGQVQLASNTNDGLSVNGAETMRVIVNGCRHDNTGISFSDSTAAYKKTGITFPDGTTQSTSGMTNPGYGPFVWYAGGWYPANVSSVYDQNTSSYVNVLSF